MMQFQQKREKGFYLFEKKDFKTTILFFQHFINVLYFLRDPCDESNGQPRILPQKWSIAKVLRPRVSKLDLCLSSWLCYLTAKWPWASHLNPLNFGYLIFKMQIKLVVVHNEKILKIILYTYQECNKCSMKFRYCH